MTTEAEEENELAEAIKAAEELYDLMTKSEPNDKIAKFRCLALRLVDSIPLERREVPARRAIYEYVRGKILDVVPYYCKEAEDHLSKAVKLNPSLVDAWLCLGNCIWKRGDLSAAKDCFFLVLKKGPNRKELCRLSKLTRQMAQGSENKVEFVQESIQLARNAIALDVKCGNSWHNLGNAYLSSFFATGGADRYILMQSIRAYQNAEKDKRLKSSASFSSAIAHIYLDNFEIALTRLEDATSLRYTEHMVSEMIQDTVNLLDKLDDALKEYTRAKTLGSVASDLASLKQGLRSICCQRVRTKELQFWQRYYLICDSETEYFALSVHRLQYKTFKKGDQLILLEPVCHQYDFSWKGKEYNFKLIRLDYINQVIVNGKKLFQPQGVSTARSCSYSSASTSMQYKP